MTNRTRNHIVTHMRNRLVTQPADAAFHALADPTRRALLDLLRTRGSQPAGSIAALFPVSRPAISKHLRLLHQARLVEEHRLGRHRYYQLSPEPLRAVDSWLDSYRAFWSGTLSQLKAFVEAGHRQEPSRAQSKASGNLRKDVRTREKKKMQT